MAKKQKLFDTSKNPMLICCECGKEGEIVIGPYGKGRCNQCISKSNKPNEQQNKPFVYDGKVGKIQNDVLQ